MQLSAELTERGVREVLDGEICVSFLDPVTLRPSLFLDHSAVTINFSSSPQHQHLYHIHRKLLINITSPPSLPISSVNIIIQPLDNIINPSRWNSPIKVYAILRCSGSANVRFHRI